MIEKLRFSFLGVLAIAVLITACGRQVTPNPAGLGAGGAPPGFMAVTFDVGGPLNFSTYQYMIVLNTTGSGVTPSTDTLQTNWNGYSFAIVALGNGAAFRRTGRVPAEQQPAHFAGVGAFGVDAANVQLQPQQQRNPNGVLDPGSDGDLQDRRAVAGAEFHPGARVEVQRVHHAGQQPGSVAVFRFDGRRWPGRPAVRLLFTAAGHDAML